MSFDKIAGVYVYCMNYNRGMWSKEYQVLCRIQRQYKLRLTDNAIAAIEGTPGVDRRGDWTMATKVYNHFVKTRG